MTTEVGDERENFGMQKRLMIGPFTQSRTQERIWNLLKDCLVAHEEIGVWLGPEEERRGVGTSPSKPSECGGASSPALPVHCVPSNQKKEVTLHLGCSS